MLTWILSVITSCWSAHHWKILPTFEPVKWQNKMKKREFYPLKIPQIFLIHTWPWLHMVKTSAGNNEKWVVGCATEVQRVQSRSPNLWILKQSYRFCFCFFLQMSQKFVICFFTINIAIRYPNILDTIKEISSWNPLIQGRYRLITTGKRCSRLFDLDYMLKHPNS